MSEPQPPDGATYEPPRAEINPAQPAHVGPSDFSARLDGTFTLVVAGFSGFNLLNGSPDAKSVVPLAFTALLFATGSALLIGGRRFRAGRLAVVGLQ